MAGTSTDAMGLVGSVHELVGILQKAWDEKQIPNTNEINSIVNDVSVVISLFADSPILKVGSGLLSYNSYQADAKDLKDAIASGDQHKIITASLSMVSDIANVVSVLPFPAVQGPAVGISLAATLAKDAYEASSKLSVDELLENFNSFDFSGLNFVSTGDAVTVASSDDPLPYNTADIAAQKLASQIYGPPSTAGDNSSGVDSDEQARADLIAALTTQLTGREGSFSIGKAADGTIVVVGADGAIIHFNADLSGTTRTLLDQDGSYSDLTFSANGTALTRTDSTFTTDSDGKTVQTIDSYAYSNAQCTLSGSVTKSVDSLSGEAVISSDDNGNGVADQTETLQEKPDGTAADDIQNLNNAGEVQSETQISTATNGSVTVLYSGQNGVVEIDNANITIAAGSNVKIIGTGDSISAAENSKVEIAENSSDDTISMGTNGAVIVDDGAQGKVIGASSINVGENAQVESLGSNTNITVATGGTITLTLEGNNNYVNDTLTLADDSTANIGAEIIATAIHANNATINSGQDSDVELTGSGNTLNLGQYGYVKEDGDDNQITIGPSGVVVTEGDNNEITGSSWDTIRDTVGSDNNTITVGDFGTVKIDGSDANVTTGANATVNVDSGSQGDVVTAGGTITLAGTGTQLTTTAYSNVEVQTDNNIVDGGDDSSITVDANVNGTNINVTGGIVTLGDGSTSTLSGDSNAVYAGQNITLTAQGQGDDINAGAGSTITSGTENTVSGDGVTIVDPSAPPSSDPVVVDPFAGGTGQTIDNGDGTKSYLTDDGQGDTTDTTYDASTGKFVSKTWANEDGSDGGTYYTGSGGSSSWAVNADGTSTSSYDDGDGDTNNTLYAASGRETSDTWTNNSGYSGSDVFNSDGSSLSITDQGGYITERTNDGRGNSVSITTETSDDRIISEFSNYVGGTSESIYYSADGSSTGGTWYANGDSTSFSDDGRGNSETYNYSGSRKTGDTWTHSDGTSGTDTFNADGSSSGIINNLDDSSRTYTNDGHGHIVTTDFASTDPTSIVDGVLETVDANGKVVDITPLSLDALDVEAAINVASNLNAEGTASNVGTEEWLVPVLDTSGNLDGFKLEIGTVFDNDGLLFANGVAFGAANESIGNLAIEGDWSFSKQLPDGGWDNTNLYVGADNSGYILGDNDGSTRTTLLENDGTPVQLDQISTLSDGTSEDDRKIYDSQGTLNQEEIISQAPGGEATTTVIYGDTGTSGSGTTGDGSSPGDGNGNAGGGSGSTGSQTTTEHTDDGQGNITDKVYSSAGELLSESWVDADGSSGETVYEGSGGFNSTIQNADGTSATSTDDGRGDTDYTLYSPEGKEVSDAWSNSYGQSGTDVFNSDGSSVRTTTYDGSNDVTVQTNDGDGNVVSITTDTSDDRIVSENLDFADGEYENINYASNGSSTDNSYYANGDSILSSDDGHGNTDTSDYSGSQKTGDQWTHADGTRGTDIFNADGTSSGVVNNLDGSSKTYINDGHGNITTTDIATSDPTVAVDGVLETVDSSGNVVDVTPLSTSALDIEAAINAASAINAGVTATDGAEEWLVPVLDSTGNLSGFTLEIGTADGERVDFSGGVSYLTTDESVDSLTIDKDWSFTERLPNGGVVSSDLLIGENNSGYSIGPGDGSGTTFIENHGTPVQLDEINNQSNGTRTDDQKIFDADGNLSLEQLLVSSVQGQNTAIIFDANDPNAGQGVRDVGRDGYDGATHVITEDNLSETIEDDDGRIVAIAPITANALTLADAFSTAALADAALPNGELYVPIIDEWGNLSEFKLESGTIYTDGTIEFDDGSRYTPTNVAVGSHMGDSEWTVTPEAEIIGNAATNFLVDDSTGSFIRQDGSGNNQSSEAVLVQEEDGNVTQLDVTNRNADGGYVEDLQTFDAEGNVTSDVGMTILASSSVHIGAITHSMTDTNGVVESFAADGTIISVTALPTEPLGLAEAEKIVDNTPLPSGEFYVPQLDENGEVDGFKLEAATDVVRIGEYEFSDGTTLTIGDNAAQIGELNQFSYDKQWQIDVPGQTSPEGLLTSDNGSFFVLSSDPQKPSEEVEMDEINGDLLQIDVTSLNADRSETDQRFFLAENGNVASEEILTVDATTGDVTTQLEFGDADPLSGRMAEANENTLTTNADGSTLEELSEVGSNGVTIWDEKISTSATGDVSIIYSGVDGEIVDNGASITIADGSKVTIIGTGDEVNAGDNVELTVAGDFNIFKGGVNGTDTIEGLGEIISATDSNVYLGGRSDADQSEAIIQGFGNAIHTTDDGLVAIYGDYDSIAQDNGTVFVSGSNDYIVGSNEDIKIADDSVVQVDGNENVADAGTNDGILFNGDGNTVTQGGAGNLFFNGTDETANIDGSNVSLYSGSEATINGSGDNIQETASIVSVNGNDDGVGLLGGSATLDGTGLYVDAGEATINSADNFTGSIFGQNNVINAGDDVHIQLGGANESLDSGTGLVLDLTPGDTNVQADGATISSFDSNGSNVTITGEDNSINVYDALLTVSGDENNVTTYGASTTIDGDGNTISANTGETIINGDNNSLVQSSGNQTITNEGSGNSIVVDQPAGSSGGGGSNEILYPGVNQYDYTTDPYYDGGDISGGDYYYDYGPGDSGYYFDYSGDYEGDEDYYYDDGDFGGFFGVAGDKSTISLAKAADAVSHNGDAKDVAVAKLASAEVNDAISTDTQSAVLDGAKWGGDVVTWSLANAANDQAGQFSGYLGAGEEAAVEQAFSTWSTASGLTFVEVSDSSQSDIRLGEGAFDTTNTGVVGYTSFASKAGVMQADTIIRVEDTMEDALASDADGAATYGSTDATLEQVLLHEIGHALGLADNASDTSIESYYLGSANRGLSNDDIAAIQSLYGGSADSNTVSVSQLVQAMASFAPQASAQIDTSITAANNPATPLLAANH